jgi:hypothetical protein
MLRPRVLRHWAKVTGGSISDFKIHDHARDILADDTELTCADLKKWMLRECDAPDREYWLPHRIVSCGAVVRCYYTWIGLEPSDIIIVLVIGSGCAEIHRWREGSHMPEVTPAALDQKGERPDVQTSLQIAQYLSTVERPGPSMKINGADLKKIV